MASVTRDLADQLRQYALTLPAAYEDFPWGECVIKVNKKIFVFLGLESGWDDKVNLGVKLPLSGGMVLQLPNTAPMGYNLGKSGWVTVQCLATSLPALELLHYWIEESYRAVASKNLLTQLENMVTLPNVQ